MANLIVARPIDLATAIALQDLLSFGGRNDAPSCGEQLQPVVLRRVMAGGDLHTAACSQRSHQHAYCRRGSRAGVNRVEADRFESTGNRGGDHPSGVAPVAPDDDRPSGGQRLTKCADVADGQLRRKAFTDDSAQSRNAK